MIGHKRNFSCLHVLFRPPTQTTFIAKLITQIYFNARGNYSCILQPMNLSFLPFFNIIFSLICNLTGISAILIVCTRRFFATIQTWCSRFFRIRHAVIIFQKTTNYKNKSGRILKIISRKREPLSGIEPETSFFAFYLSFARLSL